MVTRGFTGRPRQTNDAVPPGQFVTDGFPVLTAGATPQVHPRAWELVVTDGTTAKTYTWVSLRELGPWGRGTAAQPRTRPLTDAPRLLGRRIERGSAEAPLECARRRPFQLTGDLEWVWRPQRSQVDARSPERGLKDP
jgi:hypothetical protein